MDNIQLAQQLLSEYNHEQLENDCDINNSTKHDERSNNNESDVYTLNERGLISVNFIWFEGLRSGSRLVWVPDEECIYYSNAINKKFNASAFTCFDARCKARILIFGDDTAGKELNTPNHYLHGSHYKTYKERCLFVWMKERCRTAPASALIRNIFDEAVIE